MRILDKEIDIKLFNFCLFVFCRKSVMRLGKLPVRTPESCPDPDSERVGGSRTLLFLFLVLLLSLFVNSVEKKQTFFPCSYRL